jgi:hypothetical protein
MFQVHKNNCKKKIGSHDMKHTDSSIIIVRNVCVLTSASMIVYLFFTRSWSKIIGPKLFFTTLWTVIIGTNQFQILCHAHIICITVLENRIVCCQIFCDLLLRSAIERIFNVMHLILATIKWHIVRLVPGLKKLNSLLPTFPPVDI